MNRRSGAAVSERPPDEPDFMERLVRLIRPIAAEAVCHGLEEEQFGSLCADICRELRQHHGSGQGE